MWMTGDENTSGNNVLVAVRAPGWRTWDFHEYLSSDVGFINSMEEGFLLVLFHYVRVAVWDLVQSFMPGFKLSWWYLQTSLGQTGQLFPVSWLS